MSPSEVSRLLELVQETRDAGIRTEEHIKQINEKLQKGSERMDEHSNQFPVLSARVLVLENGSAASKKKWDSVSEPVRIIFILFLTLAATAFWTWCASFVKIQHHPSAAATKDSQ